MRFRLRRLLLGLVSAFALGAAVEPPRNVAAAASGAVLSGPRNSSGSRGAGPVAIDGRVEVPDAHTGYMWASLDTPLVVRFAHPCTVNAVELFLLDITPRDYGYVVETSPDGAAWETAVDRSQARDSGRQLHRFSARQAAALRVRFTRTSVPERSYHVVEVAAYELPEGVTATPLQDAWDAARTRRGRGAAALLGVPEAERLLAEDELLRAARALGQGTVLQRDLDGDGDPDVLIYRDGKTLVAAIDDNDDLQPRDTTPDGRDDCLAVDLGGDGVLDRVVDYIDEDRNGFPDHMVQIYATGSPWGRQAMVLAVDIDQRGPRRLWSLTPAYGYDQETCQWTCDFGGDGWFVLFTRDHAAGQWVGSWENPFCFYDPDGDGLAEETVRISGTGTRVRSARYGINADNDVTPGQDYDYDVSVTALGKVTPAAEEFTRFAVRSGEITGEFLRWERVREVVRTLPWERALLVWDENDRNVAPGDTHERWEGIINSACRGFPQEGGPPCGTINKRYELDADCSGRLRLYYWPADRRLHLAGAEQGTLTVDYDGDGRTDLTVEYRDQDGDGFFDERTIETREPPRRRTAAGAAPATDTIPLSYEAVAALWPGRLEETLAGQEALLAAFSEVTGERYLAGGPLEFLATAPERRFPAVAMARQSREARRFLADLEIELRFARLMAAGEGARGDAGKAPGSAGAPGGEALAQRLAAAQALADRGALAEAAAVLRGQAPAAAGAAQEAAAAATPAPAEAGAAGAVFALLNEKITAGWESEVMAYRAYWGKVDVFGKTERGLRLADFCRPGADYHRDLGWGMDILHNGLTSGLGGLNLWAGGRHIQAQWTKAADPAVPLRYRVDAAGPGEAAVEMLIEGWDTPCGRLAVRQRFAIAPGQRHTVSRVRLERTGAGEFEFGPGLVTFPQGEVRASLERGFVAVWGDQGIGAGPVGLAVVFDPALGRRLETAPDEILVHLAGGASTIETVLLLSAAWAKEGSFTTAEAWWQYVEGLGPVLAGITRP